MPAGLTEIQVQTYLEDGFLPIGRLFDPGLLDPLITELNEAVDIWTERYYAEGRLADRFVDEPFERRLYLVHEAMDGHCRELMEAVLGKRKTAGMFHVMTLPEILDVVESLIGPEILVHPQFNSRAKLPDRTSIVDWHQDIGFLDPDVMQTFMVNFWLPLVDSNENNGCLEVIRGSHRSDRLPFEDSPENIDPDAIPEGERVSCPIPMGGVLLLQHTTVHRSSPNHSDQIRWSLDIRYSDWRKPTGRDDVPGFIARSLQRPEMVATGHEEWQRMFEV